MKTNKLVVKDVLEYLDKMGVEYTHNSNPTPEEVADIKERIRKQDLLMEEMRDLYASTKKYECVNADKLQQHQTKNWSGVWD